MQGCNIIIDCQQLSDSQRLTQVWAPAMSTLTLSKMGNFTLVVHVMHKSYCSHKKWAQKSTDLHVLNTSTTQRRQK